MLIPQTTKTHSVQKAATFLKDISAASDENYFYFWSQCYLSFRKNDALCILSGEVNYVSCSCVAGRVGFCNHVLALLMKMCQWTWQRGGDATKTAMYIHLTTVALEGERRFNKSTTSNGGVGDQDLLGANQIISTGSWYQVFTIRGKE